MQSVGQAWLVLELTNSPFKLGVISALQFAPILFFSFVAGAIADRVPKRRLIVGTQTALLAQAFGLSALIWSGHVQYWHVATLAALYGLANAVDMPARQSFVGEMVESDDLANAIALNSAAFSGARIVGPAAAGLLVAHYGVGLAFFLNGVSFLAVILALLAIRTEGFPRPRKGTTVLQEIAEGVGYAVRTPRVSLVLSLLLTVSVFVINYNILVPLFARDVLHQGAHGFGFLMAALGAGALAGALVLTLLRGGQPPLVLVVAPAAGVCAAILSLAPTRQFWLASGLLFVAGFSQILFTASSNTTLQVTAPNELRGRMMSLYALVFAGVTPIGSLLIGLIAEALGVSAACAVGGGLGLVCVLALSARWKRRGAAWSVEKFRLPPRYC